MPIRARLMQETWRAFAAGMAGSVAAVFGDGRSPPEIAYAIGEIVHNSFRTRGVTLTSYELRRLVAELLAQRAAPRAARRRAARSCRFAGEPSTSDGVVDGRRPPLRHRRPSAMPCSRARRRVW